ncbi:MAG: ferritin [bacterium]
MMEKKLIEQINEQINKELYSEYYYVSMAAYFKDKGLDGFANFFIVQAREEHFHAMKFFNYIYERGGSVVLDEIKKPPSDFADAEDIFKKALEHEQFVTKSINGLMKTAKELNDYASESFLQWYIDEQVEEEDSMQTLLDKVAMIKNSPNGLLMMDKELAGRTFTPPSAEE